VDPINASHALSECGAGDSQAKSQVNSLASGNLLIECSYDSFVVLVRVAARGISAEKFHQRRIANRSRVSEQSLNHFALSVHSDNTGTQLDTLR
jgi:hypothetical protein